MKNNFSLIFEIEGCFELNVEDNKRRYDVLEDEFERRMDVLQAVMYQFLVHQLDFPKQELSQINLFFDGSDD